MRSVRDAEGAKRAQNRSGTKNRQHYNRLWRAIPQSETTVMESTEGERRHPDAEISQVKGQRGKLG
jgi:hypothetical protein